MGNNSGGLPSVGSPPSPSANDWIATTVAPTVASTMQDLILQWELTILTVLLCILGWIAWRCLATKYESVLKHAIQAFDRTFMNTDVKIGKLHSMHFKLNHATTSAGIEFNITDLVVENPVGFDSEYVLKAQEVHLHISKITFSDVAKGYQIVVDKLSLKNVDVIIEYETSKKRSCSTYLSNAPLPRTNLETIVQFMDHRVQTVERDGGGWHDEPLDKDELESRRIIALWAGGMVTAFSVGVILSLFIIFSTLQKYGGVITASVAGGIVAIVGTCACCGFGWLFAMFAGSSIVTALRLVGVMESDGNSMVHLCELDIEDIALEYHGSSYHAADVRYDNFSEEVGKYYTDDIVWFVLSSLTKSFLARVLGKEIAQRSC